MADPTRAEINAAKAALLAPPVLTAMDIARAEIAAEAEAARAKARDEAEAARLNAHNDSLRAQAEEQFALCALDPARYYTPRARSAFAAAGMQGDERAVALRKSVKLANGKTRAEAEAEHAEAMKAKREARA